MRRARCRAVRGGLRAATRVALLIGLTACGSGEDLDDVDGSGYDRAAAQRACREMVDALAERIVALCEGAGDSDRVSVAREIERGLPGGTSCRDALRLRDEASFYERCLPGVRDLDACPESGFVLPDACLGQIYFPG